MWKWLHIQHNTLPSVLWCQWLSSFLWSMIKLMASNEFHDKIDAIKKNTFAATYKKMPKSILCNKIFRNIAQSSRHKKSMIKLYWTLHSDDGEYWRKKPLVIERLCYMIIELAVVLLHFFLIKNVICQSFTSIIKANESDNKLIVWC